VKYISGTILDDRPIRVDFDWGFQEGRQWGRGRSGGQVSCYRCHLLPKVHPFTCFKFLSYLFSYRCVMNIVPIMILISF
jgi:hypothetical protein